MGLWLFVFLSAAFASPAVSELKIVVCEFIGLQGHQSSQHGESYKNLRKSLELLFLTLL
jgi:hypothetical protein